MRVFGCVVELYAAQDAPSLLGFESPVERRSCVSVKVVQNHPHLLGFGVVLVNQPSHLLGEVNRGAPLGDLNVTPPSLGLK